MLDSASFSSNSSSISPTISSSTSSIVSRPAVWPNSSMTMAMWLRLVRKSRSRSFSALRLGHEERRAQQRAQVQVGRALQLQQVLGHQDADDVVALLLEHRKARVAGADDDVEHLVVRRVDVEQVHVAARDHHVAGGHVGHPDDALEHHPRLGLDQLLVLGVGERLDELVARVGARRDEVEELLEKGALLGAARRPCRRRARRGRRNGSDIWTDHGRREAAAERCREAYRKAPPRSLTGLLP